MSQNGNRNSIINRIKQTAAKLSANTAQGISLTWQLAEEFVSLRSTFPAGKEGNAAFLSTASTASGKGEATVRNMVRAYEVREGLTAKQRESVASWPYDSVLTLAGKDVTSAKRTSIIGKVQKGGTTNTKDVRRIKSQVMGTVKRDRQTSAEATVKLAEKIGEDVGKLLDNGHDPMALAAGAELARNYSGDVRAAILFVAANRQTAAKVAA